MRDSDNNAWIDGDRKSYEGFYDHYWAKLIAARVHSHPSLNAAVFELLLAWKSISNAFRFPWLLPEFHEKFAEGFILGDKGTVLDFAREWRSLLTTSATSAAELPGIELALNIADDVALTMMRKRKEIARTNTAETAWNAYLNEKEFCLSIIGLMSQTYTGLVFAYEHFVLVSHRIVAPSCQLWTSQKPFEAAIESSLGKIVAQQCWNGDDMRMHRRVRNAIAHNGGKFNKSLSEWKDKLHLMGDRIQISASENRILHSQLKANVDLLVETVLGSGRP